MSFRRAAERLFVSQPSVSKQVSALERQLGLRLLERDWRRVRLTAAGETLLPEARTLLASWADAWGSARAAATEPPLVIGIQTAIGRDLLGPALAHAGQTGTRAVLRRVPWFDATVGLSDGSCDVALMWLPLPGGGPWCSEVGHGSHSPRAMAPQSC